MYRIYFTDNTNVRSVDNTKFKIVNTSLLVLYFSVYLIVC